MNQNNGDDNLIQKLRAPSSCQSAGTAGRGCLVSPARYKKVTAWPGGLSRSRRDRESAPRPTERERQSASPSQPVRRRTDSVLDNYVTVTKRAAAARPSSSRESSSSCPAPATTTASRGTQCAPGTSSRARAASVSSKCVTRVGTKWGGSGEWRQKWVS